MSKRRTTYAFTVSDPGEKRRGSRPPMRGKTAAFLEFLLEQDSGTWCMYAPAMKSPSAADKLRRRLSGWLVSDVEITQRGKVGGPYAVYGRFKPAGPALGAIPGVDAGFEPIAAMEARSRVRAALKANG